MVLRRGESHEQDGERLPSAAMPQTETASGDPAMAFEPSIERTGDHSTRLPKSAAVSLPAERRIYPGIRFKMREHAAHKPSTANTQLLDQRLVTRCVDTGEVVEKLATLGHKLEQSTPGMVVLDVGLEMLGEAVDALREDRHLHFRRTGIAGLGRVGLDDFGLAAGGYRHRVVLVLLGSWSAGGPGCRPARSPQVVRAGHARAGGAISQNAGRRQRKLWRPRATGKNRHRRLKALFTGILRRQPPGRLKIRRGGNSPLSTPASATTEPWDETDTQPPMTGASRPRSNTACPRASRPASPGLTRSAGSSASPASTGRRAARSATSSLPGQILCKASSVEATSSPKGPTAVRRSAATCPRHLSARPRSRASART